MSWNLAFFSSTSGTTSVGEGGTITYQITRNNYGSQTIYFSTFQDYGLNVGDYSTNYIHQFNFGYYETGPQYVTIQTNRDDIYGEGTEYFAVGLHDGYYNRYVSSVFSIVDTTPVVTQPSVSVGQDTTVRESDGSVFVSVTLDKAPTSAVSVQWFAAPGDATGGSDYTSVFPGPSTTLTWNPGDSLTKQVQVFLINEAANVDKPTEYFYVKLKNPTGMIINDDSATVTIIDSYVAASGDQVAPRLQSTSPSDGATSVSIAANITLVFNESVLAGTGNISIFGADGTIASSISVNDSSQVTFAGNQCILNPAGDLSANKSYFVKFAAGVIKDLSGNSYAGIADSTSLNFTTIGAVTPPPLPSVWKKPIALTDIPLVNLSVNQGINGAFSHDEIFDPKYPDSIIDIGGQHSIDLRAKWIQKSGNVAAHGQDVFSVTAGTVVKTDGLANGNSALKYITILSDNGLYVSYLHLFDSDDHPVGAHILAGEKIGVSGYSGLGGVASAAHLHIQFGTTLNRYDKVGNLISTNGSLAHASTAFDGVPGAFFAAHFLGVNKSEVAALVDVSNPNSILANDMFGTAKSNYDDDQLDGSEFGERIFAGGGNDILNGMGGNDVLVGGSGRDIMSGGVGLDQFVFGTKLGKTEIDTIKDFSVVDDSIILDDAIFSSLGGLGNLTTGEFNLGTKATQLDDRIIYNSNTGALIYDFNGSASGGGVQFASVSAGLALTNLDFIII
jgi:Ca2+-binding RTX toxin-like protein